MLLFKPLSGREAFSEPRICTKHFQSLVISPDHSEKGKHPNTPKIASELKGWMEWAHTDLLHVLLFLIKVLAEGKSLPAYLYVSIIK